MNDAQKRMAKKVLSMNSSRKDKKQDLNSSLYDKRVFNEMREGLADYPAGKLKSALSGYITDPIFITSVTNDNGNITVNYRFLDENLNEEFINAEIGYGLDYIENIHLYSSRQGTCSGRTPMIHRLKSVNSSKMTADQAKQKYKELLTQCYISVYDHKLDVNDPQVVEYRKQMNELVDEFGYLYNIMNGYIKSLDKKYKNSIDFTADNLNSSADSDGWKETYHVNHDGTLASMVHYNDITGEYDGEVVWIDKNGEPQQKKYKGEYNPRHAFAPYVGYWIKNDTKDYTVDECDSKAYIEACNTIKDAVKNKWTSENSSRRGLNCMTERAFVDEVYYYINLIPDDVTTTPIVVSGAVEVATSGYDFTVYALTDDGKFKVSTLKSTFAESLTTPQIRENEAQLLKLVKDMLLQELGTDAFIECDDDKVVYAQINDLKDKAAFIKAQQDDERKRQNAAEFEREYGVRPEDWHPFNDLLNSANSSRRRRMNASRRRLNSAVARRSGNDDYQTYYFITEDGSLVASFDVSYNDSTIDYTGFIRGYSADNYVVDERYIMDELAADTDVSRALADRVYDLTGVDVYETNDTAEFTAQLREINKIFRKANRG